MDHPRPKLDRPSAVDKAALEVYELVLEDRSYAILVASAVLAGVITGIAV